jgi:hypothetical protein
MRSAASLVPLVCLTIGLTSCGESAASLAAFDALDAAGQQARLDVLDCI